MKNVGILGYGEIGKAIGSFYINKDINLKKGKKYNLYISDFVKGNNFPKKIDILHVCIPFKAIDEFLATIFKYNDKYKPKYIVIHSTVEMGTTSLLNRYLEGKVVHSPCRGVHPFLYEGIKTFVKYIGCDNLLVGLEVQNHLNSLGMITQVIQNSRHTELGKLLDTTYYGICIAFHDYADKLCENEGLNFNIVMKDFNETYNDGYKKLGKANVVRPVLFPPHGKIGGHCVTPNAEILQKQFGENSLLKSILDVK